MKRLQTILMLLICSITLAQLPQEYSYSVNTSFTNPIATVFRNQYMVTAERAGKVYISDQVNGVWVKRNTPVIDITNEVTTYFERGVQNVVVQANFIFLYYTVEEDFLFGPGQPENGATINRITRWEISYINNFSVDRTVILGQTAQDGIPSLSGNHQGGGMAFDADGYLYVSTGDGANTTYEQDAIDKGILSSQMIGLDGRWKAQTLESMNGKILRILPWTGEGVHSNPFHDWNNRKSPKSRFWAMGVRNGFRMSIRNGMLYLCDVGNGSFEEINTIPINTGGYNLGWGLHEGLNVVSSGMTQTNPYENQLYGNLLAQATDYTVDNDDTQRRFTHYFPSLDYSHASNTSLGVRVPSFINNTLTPEMLSVDFEGNSITGGIELQGFGRDVQYLFCDYTKGWINIAHRGTGDNYFDDVEILAPSGFNQVVHISQDNDGDVYLTALNNKVYRMKYNSTLSLPEFSLVNMPMDKEYRIFNIVGQTIRKGITDENLIGDIKNLRGILMFQIQGYKPLKLISNR